MAIYINYTNSYSYPFSGGEFFCVQEVKYGNQL